jgi:ribosome-associated toxin RatA of RatAB toxin-antitoxin module
VREVRIVAVIADVQPDEAFAAVTDVERFPTLCDDVREARVTMTDGARQSAWKVKFRGGILEWIELDQPDNEARTMSFRQIEGDFKEFDGEWRVQPSGIGSSVEFTARFDLGIPALRAVLEPIAAKSLRTNLSAVLRGLFGADIDVEGG